MYLRLGHVRTTQKKNPKQKKTHSKCVNIDIKNRITGQKQRQELKYAYQTCLLLPLKYYVPVLIYHCLVNSNSIYYHDKLQY